MWCACLVVLWCVVLYCKCVLLKVYVIVYCVYALIPVASTVLFNNNVLVFVYITIVYWVLSMLCCLFVFVFIV